jgi:hypothetical protein
MDQLLSNTFVRQLMFKYPVSVFIQKRVKDLPGTVNAFAEIMYDGTRFTILRTGLEGHIMYRLGEALSPTELVCMLMEIGETAKLHV